MIMSKCFKTFLFIVNDHMYIMNFFTQMKRNFLKLGFKTIGRDLIWPSPVTRRTPFKSKIKWYSLTSTIGQVCSKKPKFIPIHSCWVSSTKPEDGVNSYLLSFVKPKVVAISWCVTSNTNLLWNKICRWINHKQIDFIQGNHANNFG